MGRRTHHYILGEGRAFSPDVLHPSHSSSPQAAPKLRVPGAPRLIKYIPSRHPGPRQRMPLQRDPDGKPNRRRPPRPEDRLPVQIPPPHHPLYNDDDHYYGHHYDQSPTPPSPRSTPLIPARPGRPRHSLNPDPPLFPAPASHTPWVSRLPSRPLHRRCRS